MLAGVAVAMDAWLFRKEHDRRPRQEMAGRVATIEQLAVTIRRSAFCTSEVNAVIVEV